LAKLYMKREEPKESAANDDDDDDNNNSNFTPIIDGPIDGAFFKVVCFV